MIHEMKCYYCGEPASGKRLHRDHLKPKSKGGSSHQRNIVYACGPCNSTKGDRTIEQARLALLQRRIGWPKFNADQIEWLRSQGFDTSPLDTAKLAFEE